MRAETKRPVNTGHPPLPLDPAGIHNEDANNVAGKRRCDTYILSSSGRLPGKFWRRDWK